VVGVGDASAGKVGVASTGAPGVALGSTAVGGATEATGVSVDSCGSKIAVGEGAAGCRVLQASTVRTSKPSGTAA
jgi:hypothetical protein